MIHVTSRIVTGDRDLLKMKCYMCILILFSITSSSLTSNLLQDLDVYFNKAVVVLDQPSADKVVEVHGSVAGVSLNQCLKHCMTRPACDFFNFKTVVHLCIFIRQINVHSPVQVQEKYGYVYSRKSDWNMDSYLHPDCKNCNLTDRCVEEKDGASCETANCGEPMYEDMTLVDGNIFNIGGRLKFVCKYDMSLVVHTNCTAGGAWTKTGPLCPQTATTTTPGTELTPPPPIIHLSEFTCHDRSDGLFRTVILDDGTTTTYSIRRDVKVRGNAAENKCNLLNAHLFKVTSAKLQFLSILHGCPGIGGFNLWVDGRLNQTVRDYMTWDGDIIPLTTEFWQFVPEIPNSKECVIAQRLYGFKLHERGCHLLHYSLCEK